MAAPAEPIGATTSTGNTRSDSDPENSAVNANHVCEYADFALRASSVSARISAALVRGDWACAATLVDDAILTTAAVAHVTVHRADPTSIAHCQQHAQNQPLRVMKNQTARGYAGRLKTDGGDDDDGDTEMMPVGETSRHGCCVVRHRVLEPESHPLSVWNFLRRLLPQHVGTFVAAHVCANMDAAASQKTSEHATGAVMSMGPHAAEDRHCAESMSYRPLDILSWSYRLTAALPCIILRWSWLMRRYGQEAMCFPPRTALGSDEESREGGIRRRKAWESVGADVCTRTNESSCLRELEALEALMQVYVRCTGHNVRASVAFMDFQKVLDSMTRFDRQVFPQQSSQHRPQKDRDTAAAVLSVSDACETSERDLLKVLLFAWTSTCRSVYGTHPDPFSFRTSSDIMIVGDSRWSAVDSCLRVLGTHENGVFLMCCAILFLEQSEWTCGVGGDDECRFLSVEYVVDLLAKHILCPKETLNLESRGMHFLRVREAYIDRIDVVLRCITHLAIQRDGVSSVSDVVKVLLRNCSDAVARCAMLRDHYVSDVMFDSVAKALSLIIAGSPSHAMGVADCVMKSIASDAAWVCGGFDRCADRAGYSSSSQCRERVAEKYISWLCEVYVLASLSTDKPLLLFYDLFVLAASRTDTVGRACADTVRFIGNLLSVSDAEVDVVSSDRGSTAACDRPDAECHAVVAPGSTLPSACLVHMTAAGFSSRCLSLLLRLRECIVGSWTNYAGNVNGVKEDGYAQNNAEKCATANGFSHVGHDANNELFLSLRVYGGLVGQCGLCPTAAEVDALFGLLSCSCGDARLVTLVLAIVLLIPPESLQQSQVSDIAVDEDITHEGNTSTADASVDLRGIRLHAHVAHHVAIFVSTAKYRMLTTFVLHLVWHGLKVVERGVSWAQSCNQLYELVLGRVREELGYGGTASMRTFTLLGLAFLRKVTHVVLHQDQAVSSRWSASTLLPGDVDELDALCGSGSAACEQRERVLLWLWLRCIHAEEVSVRAVHDFLTIVSGRNASQGTTSRSFHSFDEVRPLLLRVLAPANGMGEWFERLIRSNELLDNQAIALAVEATVQASKICASVSTRMLLPSQLDRLLNGGAAKEGPPIRFSVGSTLSLSSLVLLILHILTYNESCYEMLQRLQSAGSGNAASGGSRRCGLYSGSSWSRMHHSDTAESVGASMYSKRILQMLPIASILGCAKTVPVFQSVIPELWQMAVRAHPELLHFDSILLRSGASSEVEALRLGSCRRHGSISVAECVEAAGSGDGGGGSGAISLERAIVLLTDTFELAVEFLTDTVRRHSPFSVTSAPSHRWTLDVVVEYLTPGVGFRLCQHVDDMIGLVFPLVLSGDDVKQQRSMSNSSFTVKTLSSRFGLAWEVLLPIFGVHLCVETAVAMCVGSDDAAGQRPPDNGQRSATPTWPRQDASVTRESILADPLLLLHYCPRGRVFSSAVLSKIWMRVLHTLLTANRGVFHDFNLLVEGQALASHTLWMLQLSEVVQFLIEVAVMLMASGRRQHSSTGVEMNHGEASVSTAIYDFLHELFIDEPLLLKLVHFQMYSVAALPGLVEHVPSMHACIEFIPELVYVHPDVSKRLFGVHVLVELTRKFPMESTHALCSALVGHIAEVFCTGSTTTSSAKDAAVVEAAIPDGGFVVSELSFMGQLSAKNGPLDQIGNIFPDLKDKCTALVNDVKGRLMQQSGGP